MRLRPLLRTLRAGDTRGRLAALRASRKALDVAIAGAALRTGLLEQLREPTTVEELAARRGWSDSSLVEAALRSFAAHGLLEDRGGRWQTSRRARRILDDDIVQAVYEGFSTYHTDLYRDLDSELVAGGDRRDIEVDGELIARLSRAMDEFVLAELRRVAAEQAPRRLLDVGCGTAAHLRHLVRDIPSLEAVGIETDADAARLARAAVEREGFEDRAEVVEAEVAAYLEQQPGETFDLVLLANVVYYVPLDERVALFRSLAECLDPGGRLVVVSTMLTDDAFSRHFDLLLRSQAGRLELPDADVLVAQLTEAGLVPDAPRRIAPGEPLAAVVARRRAD